MLRMTRLAFTTPLILAVAAACSASGNDTGNSIGAGGSSTGGGGGQSGNDGGTQCGGCDLSGKIFTPCVNGQPGNTVTCEFACEPNIGCVDCIPGQNICEGNNVHICKPDGSGPGEQVEQCDVAAGQVCSDGKCGDPCQLAADSPSNIGCEFWAVDLDQQDGGGNDPASAPWGVALANAGQSQANITIEINEAPPGMPVQTKVVNQVSVMPGQLEAIGLPTRELDCGTMPNDYKSPGTCLSSRAYRITSSAPIVVYQFNGFTNSFSNDASLLLPTAALGKIYRVMGWIAGHPVEINFPPLPPIGPDRTYITVIGTEPNTNVKVRPSYRIRGNPPIAATDPGGEIEVTLGPFDVLNLESDDGTFPPANEWETDLTSSVVLADKRVAVFSGVESTSAPGPVDIPTYPGWETSGQNGMSGSSCCLDHLEDQMFPVESIGQEYVVTRSPVRSSGSYREPDVIRFLGGFETAQVTTSLPAPYNSFELAPGEIVTTYAQDDFTASGTKPFLVGQYLISQGYVDGGAVGDPALTMFSPVEQYRTEYVILTPPSWTQNWVVISAEVGATVLLDGNPTNNCIIEPAGAVQGKSYESRRCTLTEGTHSLTGDLAFGIVAYGYGSAGSYAFAGGADVKPIYEPPPIK